MQAGVGLLVSDVMPIYMIIPDILITMLNYVNCSIVICSPTIILMLSREATSETYGPRVYFPSYLISRQQAISGAVFILLSLLCIFYFSNLYHKIQKNIYLIILSLPDLTFASGREGIDSPFITLVARFLFVCIGTRDLHVASYWIDTLVVKTEGNTYATLAASPSPL